MTAGKSAQLAIAVFVAPLFLWLTLRDIQLRGVQLALADSNLGLIALALAAVAIGYSCRIQRWRLMLRLASPRLRWSACAGPLLAGFAANNLLPLRAGDFMRVFAFNAKLEAPSGVVLATVFVERLLDLLVILGFFGAALAVFDINSNRLYEGLGVSLMGVAAAVLSILLFPRIMAPAVQVLSTCAARWVPRFSERIAEESARSLSTLEALAGRRMTILVLWSIAVWLAEGCAFWLTALAFPSLVTPLAAWFALPVSAFATLVPSAPASIGTFDFFTTLAMTALGNDVTSAAAYALSVHVVVWLPSTTGGCMYLLMLSIREQGRKATDRCVQSQDREKTGSERSR